MDARIETVHVADPQRRHRAARGGLKFVKTGPHTGSPNGGPHGLLQSLGRDAAHNHRVLKRFQQRELALLRAEDLPALLDRLTRGMRRSFGLDCVRLKLLDPFSVIRDLLSTDSELQPGLMRDVHLCTDISTTRAAFPDLREPWLGPWSEADHYALFGLHLGGSVALLPLRQADGLSGFLCLGSRDPGRFNREHATDFLAHLACLASVCLENAVNRERLHLAGHTDSLTGLYNRRHLQHRLAQEVTRARRYGQPLSCLFVDADHFKQINDRFGHAVGDRVLVALAQRLRARLRASDLPTRYGGEEFAILLPQTGLAAAEILAREICTEIAATSVMLDSGEHVPVTVSIGVAAMTSDGGGDGLLKSADDAVYRAKHLGRNRVEIAEQ